MIEVAPRLYVGNALDYENLVKGRDGWAVLQCCKEPYHRKALGYTGRGAPRDHEEYLFARRDERLILNMVDVDDPAYIAPEMVDAGLSFVGAELGRGRKVLIHCNQGGSRAPSLALLYLRDLMPPDFEEAEDAFRGIYPAYQPAKGIREYLKKSWGRDQTPA